MRQQNLAATGFELITKCTRKRSFLDEVEQVVPRAELIALIESHAPKGKTGHFTMLRFRHPFEAYGLGRQVLETLAGYL